MRRAFRAGLASGLAIALAFAMAACGGASTASIPPDTIALAGASLSPTSLSVPAGTTVHFADAMDGATHQLCLGKDGACHSSAGGPAALAAPGMRIEAGQTRDVVFGTAGTFTITCTIHPQMNLTITVQ